MELNIDSSIFIGFLAFNLILGLLSARGISTIKGYAIGDKNFNTATIASTIVATWVSGEFFFTIIAESYSKGIGFISIVLLGDFLGLFLIGVLFAPRMAEFLNNLSVAEAMGDLYGKHARTITAISGFVAVSGIIAIQLKITGLIFSYALGLPEFYGVIISGIIITLYSALGGIKSVTFTDIMQFVAFGVVIPTIAYLLFKGVESDKAVMDAATINPLFNYSAILSFSNPDLYYVLSLFLWGFIPAFNPAIFQRVAMAKDVDQASRSFVTASLICLLLAAVLCWIGILVLTIYPGLKENDILKVIVFDHIWFTGFKGIILAGIMAMVMSTVDSYINSSSVLLVHDLRPVIGDSFIKDELRATRICSLFIGMVSVLLTMQSGSFLDLFIWASMFYMPVVTVPLIMSIFGFRSSSKSVLIGMAAGFTTAMVWELFFKIANVGGLIPGMLANLVFLFASHYLLRQPGGWGGGNRHNSPGLQWSNKKKPVNSFSISDFCRKNTPKNDNMVALLGLFIMISSFSSSSTISREVQTSYSFLLDAIHIFTFCISTVFIGYPIWSERWKEYNFMPILWHVMMFLVLICFSFLAVLVSNFSAMQLIALMMNVVVVSYALTWRSALFFIASGMAITMVFYKNFLEQYQESTSSSYSLEFKIIYLLLLFTGALIIFLKPKQEYIEETEHKIDDLEHENEELHESVYKLMHENEELHHKVEHYVERIADQNAEIERLGATAQRILNNVNHELRLPVGNVMNFAEMLSNNLKSYNEAQLKMLADEVFKNSNRLSTMILNMLDLATLDVKRVDLQKKNVNLSELVEDRVTNCRKIYLQGKKIDFEMTIEPDIFISVDPNYIKQTVDNLVINAINYSKEGVIKVSVLRQKNMAVFTITDQGLGIPKEEIYDIFTPFKMGSNTQSKAEGRGVGLALCKSAIEAHGGAITVESNGIKGATFRFVLGI
ncbi:MAG: ATP-binding protein [Rickettsiaceae bacterium]